MCLLQYHAGCLNSYSQGNQPCEVEIKRDGLQAKFNCWYLKKKMGSGVYFQTECFLWNVKVLSFQSVGFFSQKHIEIVFMPLFWQVNCTLEFRHDLRLSGHTYTIDSIFFGTNIPIRCLSYCCYKIFNYIICAAIKQSHLMIVVLVTLATNHRIFALEQASHE